MSEAPRDVWQAIESLLVTSPTFQVGELGEQTGLTRQALHAHLRRALSEGLLVREGGGRSTRYRRSSGERFESTRPTAGLREEELWLELRAFLDESLPERGESTDAVLSYVVTELVNNAIDHSGAAEVTLSATPAGTSVELEVADAGRGAFETVRSRLGLQSHLHALQAISKGRVTTDPERHTGEGLFFSSKAVSTFELAANGLVWLVDNRIDDQAILERETPAGTRVTARLETPVEQPIEALFERYTTDFAFDRSRAVVRLFEYGRRFVSRSEAKRLAEGLERFREVELDFHGVEGVGQGFADELLRVWANAHPGTRLMPTRMNDAVAFMVGRATAPRP